MAMQWSKDLETGNPMIDTEHKTLIDTINKLMDACRAGEGRAKIGDTAQFLSTYTRTHFSHEEQLMKLHQYTLYDSHKKWHEDYCKKIDNLAVKLKAEGPTMALMANINTEAAYLVTHIKTTDAGLARFMREKA